MIRSKTLANAHRSDNYVSVLDYGADPTGVQDSFAAFNQAINDNNYVWVPVGTYNISQDINITSPTKILGASAKDSIIQATSGNKLFTFTDQGNMYFDISNLYLRSAEVAIDFTDGYPWKNSRIADLTITGCTTGIRARSTKPLVGSSLINMLFSNLYIEGNVYGIDIEGLSMINGSSFRDIRILSSQEVAIRLVETNPVSITPAVELSSFTFESNLKKTCEFIGLCATCTNFYFEDNGQDSGDPEILLGDYTNSASSPTRVTFIDPYFGPSYTSDGKTSIAINGISTYLTINGLQSSRVPNINGNNYLAASKICLLGRANIIPVENFFNKEARFPERVIFWEPAISNGTEEASGNANTGGLFAYNGNTYTAQFWFELDVDDIKSLLTSAGDLRLLGLPVQADNIVGGASVDTSFSCGVSFADIQGIDLTNSQLLGQIGYNTNSRIIKLNKHTGTNSNGLTIDDLVDGTTLRIIGSFSKVYYAS